MGTIEVKVPDIGDFSDIPVISILVEAGDTVSREDPLIELESDKATMEVPSPEDGTIKEIKVKEGDTVSEGSLILLMETEGASEGDSKKDKTGEEKKPAKSEAKSESSPAPSSSPAPASTALSVPSANGQSSSNGHIYASPSIRALARELGVDLANIKGSGRKGRIIREDITAAYKTKTGGSTAVATTGGSGIPAIPAVDFSKFGPIEEVEMSRIKKISGPVLHRSWLNIPHVTHNEEADITSLDKFRRQLDSEAKPEGYRVTLLSFIILACVRALKTHWEFNSSLHPDGGKLIRKHYYNIGFAADTPQGLVVPVIKDADQKGIIEISKELGMLSMKARDGKLSPAEMSGATFTISSLGGIGGTSFTPIVNAPEVAILGLTRAKMEPIWDPVKETFTPRLMLPMSLSYDHRAIDGALAARFCATLGNILADERRLLL
ncbi:MAG TPA: dihydrolipoyllysine-residue acetyltransferase [Hyphomicrobiales bacterium]|nr:dihydrolipoyllysine-residue acetyltransferase [Hyphomicrobiales bacterium]